MPYPTSTREAALLALPRLVGGLIALTFWVAVVVAVAYGLEWWRGETAEERALEAADSLACVRDRSGRWCVCAGNFQGIALGGGDEPCEKRPLPGIFAEDPR